MATGTSPTEPEDGAATDANWRVCSKRGFWIGRALSAVALAVGSLFFMRAHTGISAAAGAVGIALFGSFALYALRQLLRGERRLALSTAGFDAADLGVGTIPWAEVEHVQSFGSREAPFVAFHVRDPGPWLARMSPWPRMIVRLLRAQGLPSFSINLIGVDREPFAIASRARTLLEQSTPPGQ